MSGERVERRLAAILAADVAGYSRLMGEDEDGTLRGCASPRLIDPKIAEHKGRIVKTTGDGILIEFPSVVEAVACAIAVQRGMAERNREPRKTSGSYFASALISATSSSRTATPRRRGQCRSPAGRDRRTGRDLRLGDGPRSSSGPARLRVRRSRRAG